MPTITRKIWEIQNDERPCHPQGPPVFVIGGPPGGGKTTVLKQLLAHERGRGRRPAVIIGELGEANVNGLLLADRSRASRGFDLHVVRSSCACCDPSPALGDLLARVLPSARGSVFLEATGLASPRQVAETVEAVLAGGGASMGHLASVIVVLDARALAASRLTTRAHKEDIAAADTVVLNKSDLVGETDVGGLVARVHSVNLAARVFAARYGSVPSARLLRAGPCRPESRPTQPVSPRATGPALVSATAELLGPVVIPRLQRLLARRRRDLVRVKGFMRTRAAPGLHELQWVPGTLEVRPRRSTLGVRTELVILGHRHLDWDRLATDIDRCVELEATATLPGAAAASDAGGMPVLSRRGSW